MSRRSETGGWQSQTQFESTPWWVFIKYGEGPTSEWDRPRHASPPDAPSPGGRSCSRSHAWFESETLVGRRQIRRTAILRTRSQAV